MEATEEDINAGDPDPPAGNASSYVDLTLAGAHRLCADAMRRLPVDGAAVSVRGGAANKELLHATDAVIARLDDLQFVLGEGPCLDAYRSRMPVLEPDLTSVPERYRWPGFAREAVGAGAAAVFAFPLQVGAVPFGILELYRAAPGALTDTDLATALLLADSGARDVLEDFVDAGLEPTVADPDPMFGRPEVPQATGVIAVQRGIGVTQALVELRAAAFAANRPIADVAADVLAGRITFTDEEPPTP